MDAIYEADTHPAGHKLDALIAKHVMGWPLAEGRRNEGGVITPCWTSWNDDHTPRPVPPYSTDPSHIAAIILEVAGWNPGLGRDQIKLEFNASGGKYQAAVCVYNDTGGGPICEAKADTLPLAICRAALSAVIPLMIAHACGEAP